MYNQFLDYFQNTLDSVMTLMSIDREADSAKASEKRALTMSETPVNNEVAVTIEKPSFLKLTKKGKARSTTTSCHTENESVL